MGVECTGLIKRIYPDWGGCYIQLMDKEPNETPKDDYFHLAIGHENYKSLFALLLLAASNRYRLKIRTENDISSTDYGAVGYMVVDW
jgi:hypothetical protein